MFHELKTWPEHFEAVATGEKCFEVRKNDRDFKTDDVLWLREYDPKTEAYTSREAAAIVSYILHGPTFGIEASYVVMSLRAIVMQPNKALAETPNPTIFWLHQ